ncbi:MAG TPA: hypothetical protein VKY74_04205, partial [Chloroflexia bacterium]|nr:hypothetical protein [Chloroflexia bacterium]
MSAEHKTGGSRDRAPAAQPAPPAPAVPAPALPAPALPGVLRHPALQGGANQPVRQAALRQLQQTHGNRAVQRLLTRGAARPPAPPLAAAPVPVQPVLTRGWGTGWGLTGWADDNAAATWKDIDTKFNTRLLAEKPRLQALQAQYPYPPAPPAAAPGRGAPAPDPPAKLAAALAAVDDLIQKWDGKDIPYAQAGALGQALNDVLHQSRTAADELVADWPQRLKYAHILLDRLMKQLGDALTKTRIAQQKFKPDNAGRKQLLAELEGIKRARRLLAPGERGKLQKQVEAIEDSYTAAHEQSLEYWRQQAAEKNQTGQDAQENARVQAETGRLRKLFGGTFNRVFQLVGADVDSLAALALRVPQPDLLHRLLSFAGKGRVAYIDSLLDILGNGSREELATLLRKTDGDPGSALPALLGRAKIATVAALVEQCQDDPSKAATLLTAGGVRVDEVEFLLGTDSRADTAFVLEHLPDSRLLQQLKGLVPAPLPFRLLVIDLAGQATPIADIKQLLARQAPVPTTADLYAELSVAQARGLRTNAGAAIPTVAVSGL